MRDAQHRSWLFRFTVDGRQRQMGLGPFPDVTLQEAREQARICRGLVRQGLDPIEVRQKERAERRAATRKLTFREVVERYIGAHEAAWTNDKHRYQWRQTLAMASGAFGHRPVADVDVADVIGLLEPIWLTKTETASRLRGRVESVLDYAAAHGWRSGDNPARWRGHLAKLLPAPSRVAKVQHQPALPWTEVKDFMAALADQGGVAALALRFTVLTAARTGEVIGARWSEIDMEAKLWTIPAERMKMKRAHRVPLSEAALRILGTLLPARTTGDWVFPGGKSGQSMSNMAMLALLRRMNPHSDAVPARWRDSVTGEPITTHGFRSTFRDWAAEASSHSREIAEAALAHVLTSRTEAAYQRGDLLEKRRNLMEDWARFCVSPEAASQVVPI